LLLFSFVKVQGQAQTSVSTDSEVNIFSDNFDSYNVGILPLSGDWELIYNGIGTQYQTINNSHYVSPPNSLQLWGAPNWACAIEKHVNFTSNLIGYEVSTLIDSRGMGGPERTSYLGLYNQGSATWGGYFAAVYFNHDTMNITAEDGQTLGMWTPGTWFNVKAILDRETNTYSVWINGQLHGSKIKTTLQDTYNLNAFALWSGHPGVKTYYDDVRVFEIIANNSPTPSPGSTTISLVSFWKCDYTTGNLLPDSLSHNDGTISSAVFGSGPNFGLGSSLRFDGNSMARVPDAPELKPLTITVEAWIYLDQLPPFAPFPQPASSQFDILSKYSYNPDYGFNLQVVNNHFKFVIGNGDFSGGDFGGWLWAEGTTNLEMGRWYYLAGTFDGNTVTVYVNGIQDGSKDKPIGYTFAASDRSIGIGGHEDNGLLEKGFKGRIDEVAFYQGALTNNQIAEHYSNGLQGVDYTGETIVPTPLSSQTPAILPSLSYVPSTPAKTATNSPMNPNPSSSPLKPKGPPPLVVFLAIASVGLCLFIVAREIRFKRRMHARALRRACLLRLAKFPLPLVSPKNHFG
jgi:hypothetical protein